ncbi:MAG TPA: hypothetical protein DCR27_06595 [Lachnospiraceae bacterium]|nr:hypothetical protein [Lachnospiraceae bacterium]
MPDTLYKTIIQYNKEPISETDMAKLEELAIDYGSVKNYVYQRYGSIRSLSKIYPGYSVQNEMTQSGLRERLGLPSVYFYSAVFDALGDIKTEWAHAKARVEASIRENPNFTEKDRHYLRFCLKQSQCLEAVLLEKEISLSGDWQNLYREIEADVENTDRLCQYLRRQVRKHLKTPHTEVRDGFSVTPKGYRYKDHGIYISTKENRKRVFVLLTDANQYDRRLYVRLYPKDGKLRISVPVVQKVKKYREYQNVIGLAVGMRAMLVTDQGHVYGGEYGVYQKALTEYVREGMIRYNRNKKNNPGRKKYAAGKIRLETALHTYINAEINRLLDTEMPETLYIPKLPQASKAGVNKKMNHAATLWQRGYVRDRLELKCRQRSVRLVEVFGKGISSICSGCGNAGTKTEELFICPSCGLQLSERENTARNVRKRGEEKDRPVS